MIEIIFIILYIFRYLKKKYQPKYLLFDANIDTDTLKKAETNNSAHHYIICRLIWL